MKLTKPVNENYAATVVRISAITPLEGRDNIVATPILGFQSIISKDHEVGEVGIMFPALTQLSDEFCRENNLYRHGNLNKDESAKGYIEDNRRVKAMKFLGHRSDCLFMPLSSLSFATKDFSQLEVGDVFDQIGGKEICKKFEIKTRGVPRVEKNKLKIFRRVDTKFLPEHYDSSQYARNKDAIHPDRTVIVTQKLHGTSIRIGNTIVKRQLSFIEKVASKLGVSVSTTELDHVYGSRKVIKDINNPNQDHFYGTDLWTEEGKKLDDVVPENFILYGELIGYTKEGAALQKNYTYKVPKGTSDLYIYRVAFVNGQGMVTDLTHDQMAEFCRDRNLKVVPELWRGLHKDFVADDWIDKRFCDYLTGVVPMEDDNKALVDEGVCIRVDGLTPYILKHKSPIFFQHEEKMIEQEALDMEAEGSVDE